MRMSQYLMSTVIFLFISNVAVKQRTDACAKQRHTQEQIKIQ
jgi:hypothetical protein